MEKQDRYEVVFKKDRFHVFHKNNLIAEITLCTDEYDTQYIKLHSMEDDIYLESEFDLSITIVPGISRSFYCHDQEVVQYIYQDIHKIQFRTWYDNTYTCLITKNKVEVFDAYPNLLATMELDYDENRFLIDFNSIIKNELKLMIALLPCLDIQTL